MATEDLAGLVHDGSDELHDTLSPPPKPHEAMLYGLVGDVARAAAEGTEVNPIAAAAAFLSFLGANAGRDAYLPIGNTWHHPRAFILHIGRSGRGGKGDAQGLVHRIRRRVEEVYSGTLGHTHTGGLSTREGLAFLIHNGYTEGKKEIPAIEDKRLWVVESEFSNVLAQSRRDGNTLSAALRDAWDGSSIKPAIRSGKVWASRPHIGILANITPTELLALLEARELSNGFANRFLMVWAERAGLVPFPQPTPRHIVEALADRTAKVVAFAKGGYPAKTDSRRMILSEGASRLYAKAYGAMRRPVGNDLLTAVLERRAPYALRLAMLFALTDETLSIGEEHMRAALAWVQYAVDTVKFVFAERAGMAAAAETEADAGKVLDFLKGRPDGATMTDINGGAFQRHASSSRIGDALKALLTANPPKIEMEELPRKDGKTGGRKAKLYRAISSSSANFANIAKLEAGQGLEQNSHVANFANFESGDEEGAGQTSQTSQTSQGAKFGPNPEPEPNFANFANFAEGEEKSTVEEWEEF